MMQGLSGILQNVKQQVDPNAFIANLTTSLDSNNLQIGLNELQSHCSLLYPDIPEPLCLRNNQSLYLGTGSDPLDYIYIYKNKGEPESGIPPHWHYVGLGLSDIYNYAMLCERDMMLRAIDVNYANSTAALPELYPPKLGPDQPKVSGFGFELTFRLQCDSSEELNGQPPMWPGRVMQDLARYVFQSMNVFKVGDHVAWRCSLDGEGESRIKHMLMTLDPQLKEVDTTLGPVKFIQIVGVCQEELQAARDYNVKGVLEIMSERAETGGQLFVTDMRRGSTIFELDPKNVDRINAGISQYGSDMTLISAKHKYSAIKPEWYKEVENMNRDIDESDDQELSHLLPDSKAYYKNSLPGVERGSLLTKESYEMASSKNQENNQINDTRVPSRMSMESESELVIERSELLEVRAYDNLYLLMNYESAKVLPVALKGRLAHGKPFTFQTFNGDLVTTFVPEGGSFPSLVSYDQPFARKGTWLQIYVSDQLRQQMLESIEVLFNQDSTTSTNLDWPDFRLHISIVDEIREAMDES